MGIFRCYLTLVLFSAGLLLGVQAPNFIDQYEKRIDAHLIEAREQLAGFMDIADRLYGGDIEKLIDRHGESPDAAFKAEQQVLVDNYDRLNRFETVKGKLSVSLPGKIVQTLLYPEREMLEETMHNYSAAFPLTMDAIFCGLTGALAVCAAFEMIVVVIKSFFGFMAGLGSRKKAKNPIRRTTKRPGKKPGVSVISLPDRQ